MSKKKEKLEITKLSEEYRHLIKQLMNKKGLSELRILCLNDPNLKLVDGFCGKTAITPNNKRDFTDHDVTFFINEDVFDQLGHEDPDDKKRYQEIVLEHLIDNISFNFETGKLSSRTPDFKVHSGFLQREGYEKMWELREMQKKAFNDVMEQRD